MRPPKPFVPKAARASERGYAAGMAGSGQHTCPYVDGTAQAREWYEWYDHGTRKKQRETKP